MSSDPLANVVEDNVEVDIPNEPEEVIPHVLIPINWRSLKVKRDRETDTDEETKRSLLTKLVKREQG